MRITTIRTAQAYGGHRNFLYVLVETDAGLTGLGEATLERRSATVARAIEEVAESLIGEDPTRIEHLWQSMYVRPFWRGGPVLMSAISGIEIALWDIRGQSLGVPIYELLGGRVRDRVRAYTHLASTTPEESAERAIALKEAGWTALKLSPFIPDERNVVVEREAAARAVRLVQAVRAAVGESMDVLIDGHGRFVPATALYFADGVRECRPLFFEEPVPPGSTEALARVHAKSPIPLATGERLFTKHGFQDVISRGLVEYVQPDVCHAGGILETKKIAAMAEASFIRLAPHNPLGPVATLACLHLAACTPNHAILETAWGHAGWWHDFVDRPPRQTDGFLALPTGPGLGARLLEDAVAAHPPQLIPPLDWWGDDGSVTEW